MNPPLNAPAIKIVKSVREQVSAEEWDARVNLAACYRLTAMHDMTELIANHISCRVPGEPNHFLINPYGMLYEEIDASCLIKVDVDGNVLFNASDYNVNAAGFVIHSAIHMARHDVDCVAHTHTPAGMAVSAMECGASAFNTLFRLERACQVQVMALSCNTKLTIPATDILEKTFDKVRPRVDGPNRNGDLAWPALLRKLDRVDPSYRD